MSLNVGSLQSNPTHLYIGSPQSTYAAIQKALAHLLCATHGCNTCTNCRLLKEHQHFQTMWFAPEKNYTREQLSPLFERVSYQLDPTERFIFIITAADQLGLTCANSLLKSLEEPPAGYYFFLETSRAEEMLPTITSRTIIHHVGTQEEKKYHPLLDHFTEPAYCDPISFAKTLEESGITEHESRILLDTLLTHWTSQLHNAIASQDGDLFKTAHRIVMIIKSSFLSLPMPGSSKLFWKNLYLECKV